MSEDTTLDPIAEDLKDRHKLAELFTREFEDVGGKIVKVYFRCATPAENHAFNAKAFDDKNPKRQAEGMTELGQRCFVHAEGVEKEALFGRRPGIALVIAGEAVRIAAGQGAELGKRV